VIFERFHTAKQHERVKNTWCCNTMDIKAKKEKWWSTDKK